ncbi:polymorphic toxin protein [Mycobacterium phage prophiGD39-2]|uniref:Tox-REase-5 domain-containing protein n=1 Tax=Mycobacteroides abscessus TaxID=36809 RepID=UPI0005DACC2C|nr:Tox-REase-5 domain-containing protein [Mycobacteroides abscessus]QPO17270.1 WXG100 domain protein [Mycobacterium phage phiGD57-1]QST88922.1 polymorphic toxin protein [Mycobacterium phage prophiGD25-1]QST89182.1 polymorphic toxin protein [Mycobacterium phage prophiGD39-2]QST89728.1 polymorphic toxin protein [Mycobacterium phage prophi57-1]KNB64122.1 hypothetical protein MAUC95_22225 [Mycobacteroides abscessus]
MTVLDEFMAKKANDYMAVVDSLRPRTAALKATYDDYKRWATTPNGTYWSGQFAGAAQEAAADDCKGTDNADDTTEDVVKLVSATIEFEVLPPLTSGQNIVTNALREGVTVGQDFTMTYHPAEGESEKSVARNKQIVADAERELREYVAKWEKATQELKTQTDGAREKMLSRINPKAALLDARKILREATPGQPAAETIDYKKQYPKATDPAGTTPAAAASGPETINYKELYPKTASVDGHQLGSLGAMPGVGDIDKTKPAKLAPTLADRDVPAFAQATRERLQHEGVPANQIEQRVNEAVQRAQAPRFAPDADPMRTPGQVSLHNSPGDQFNDIVGRANDEATKTIDGQIEQAKVLTGQAGPGAPGVAEAWKDVGLGAVKQIHELTSDPLAAPKMGIEQAKEFYNQPGEFIGKNIIHGTEALGGGAIGGEAAAGARGLLGDLTGAEGRAITHDLSSTHEPTSAHVEQPGAGAHSGPVMDHQAPSAGGDHTPPSYQPPAPYEFDPGGGQHYTSGDPHHPGGWPPGTPEATWNKGDTEPGWKHINHSFDKDWMPYQEQIGGIERTPSGALPEWVQHDLDTGAPVSFDGHTYRGPQEVFLEAKDGFRGLAFAPDNAYWTGRAESALEQVDRQLGALPPGARLEWHVSDPYGAAALRDLFDSNGVYGVEVIYTPKP